MDHAENAVKSHDFLNQLFASDDLIEIRYIGPNPVEGETTYVKNLTVGKLTSVSVKAAQENANVYFGVCLREPGKGSLAKDINRCGVLWVDKEDCTVADLEAAINEAGLPPLSTCFSSGNGAHGYYVLDDDYPADARIQNLIIAIAKAVGADEKVHDIARVMRLYPMPNRKNGVKELGPRIVRDVVYELEEIEACVKPTENVYELLMNWSWQPDAGDGSNRLMKYANAAKRNGVGADDFVDVVRRVETTRPFDREYSDEDLRRRWEDSHAKKGAVKQAAVQKPELSNFSETVSNKGNVVKVSLHLDDIYEQYRQAAPKTYNDNGNLLVYENGKPFYFEKEPQWGRFLYDNFDVKWSTQGVSKPVLMHKVIKESPFVQRVELAPHYPPIAKGVVYFHDRVRPGDGAYLERWLDRFYPETELDRALLKACLMTTFWGGKPGQRPFWVIMSAVAQGSRLGSGKTTAADEIAKVHARGECGFIDISTLKNPEGSLVDVALSGRRVVFLDNVDGRKLSGQTLARLITLPHIVGDRKYLNRSTVPNYFTFISTMNYGKLDEDAAARAIVIRLKPPPEGVRMEEVDYDLLWSDVAGWFDREPVQPAKSTRRPFWDYEIAGRFDNPTALVQGINGRARAADADVDETAEWEKVLETLVASYNNAAEAYNKDAKMKKPLIETTLDENGETKIKSEVFFPNMLLRRVAEDRDLIKPKMSPPLLHQTFDKYLGSRLGMVYRKFGGDRGWTLNPTKNGHPIKTDTLQLGELS